MSESIVAFSKSIGLEEGFCKE